MSMDNLLNLEYKEPKGQWYYNPVNNHNSKDGMPEYNTLDFIKILFSNYAKKIIKRWKYQLKKRTRSWDGFTKQM